MSRESSIVARIRERTIRKKQELETVEDQLALLLVRKEALESGIAEDERILTDAMPKKPRTRKSDSHRNAGPGTGSAPTEP
jgi:hypothetical protein